MTYRFLIDNGKLLPCAILSGESGNVNTYICEFEIHTDFPELKWFCVFARGDEAYVQELVESKCVVPFEVLKEPGAVQIGCYAINARGDEVKRISTNLVELDLEKGAYCEALTPEIPEIDAWESLVANAAPKIGENGNWYLFDMGGGCYVDSGFVAVAKDGYTPVKNVDYWTNSDKAEIKDYIDTCTAVIDEKEDKTRIVTDLESKNYTFDFLAFAGTEVRLAEAESISFDFGDGEYPADYSAGLSFTSGEVPTAIDYASGGILKWIGKDCATVDGVSVFEPSQNTQYDIVLYFNGAYIVGMVNGYGAEMA